MMNEKKYYVRNGAPVEITDELLLNYMDSAEQESNRGLLLLGVAILDELLIDLLDSYLGPGKKQEIRNNSNQRIILAESLGLLAARDATAMHKLRKHRNTCAHEVFRGDTNEKILERLVDDLKAAAEYDALGIPEARRFVDQFIFELILGLRQRTTEIQEGVFARVQEPGSMLQTF
ncbi:MAG: hypothetical protein GVY36_12710 [Verrucomicrobia bacterium]|jgi:hypothetical protein|nr:hypothetical protein [Verrucomicrobiota bacterium]